MSTRKDLNTWMVHHPLEVLFAALGIVALTVLSRINPSPEFAFTLQMVGLGGVVGLLVAYIRYHDDPEGDRWRPVAQFSLLGFVCGVGAVAADATGLI